MIYIKINSTKDFFIDIKKETLPSQHLILWILCLSVHFNDNTRQGAQYTD